jgi:NADH:ubiquinone oxidoreductase subunit C
MFGITSRASRLAPHSAPEDWNGHPLRQDYEIGFEETGIYVRKINRIYAKGLINHGGCGG